MCKCKRELKASCGEGDCGDVDDGCGGKLKCGACAVPEPVGSAVGSVPEPVGSTPVVEEEVLEGERKTLAEQAMEAARNRVNQATTQYDAGSTGSTTSFFVQPANAATSPPLPTHARPVLGSSQPQENVPPCVKALPFGGTPSYVVQAAGRAAIDNLNKTFDSALAQAQLAVVEAPKKAVLASKQEVLRLFEQSEREVSDLVSRSVAELGEEAKQDAVSLVHHHFATNYLGPLGLLDLEDYFSEDFGKQQSEEVEAVIAGSADEQWSRRSSSASAVAGSSDHAVLGSSDGAGTSSSELGSASAGSGGVEEDSVEFPSQELPAAGSEEEVSIAEPVGAGLALVNTKGVVGSSSAEASPPPMGGSSSPVVTSVGSGVGSIGSGVGSIGSAFTAPIGSGVSVARADPAAYTPVASILPFKPRKTRVMDAPTVEVVSSAVQDSMASRAAGLANSVVQKSFGQELMKHRIAGSGFVGSTAAGSSFSGVEDTTAADDDAEVLKSEIAKELGDVSAKEAFHEVYHWAKNLEQNVLGHVYHDLTQPILDPLRADVESSIKATNYPSVVARAGVVGAARKLFANAHSSPLPKDLTMAQDLIESKWENEQNLQNWLRSEESMGDQRGFGPPP